MDSEDKVPASPWRPAPPEGKASQGQSSQTTAAKGQGGRNEPSGGTTPPVTWRRRPPRSVVVTVTAPVWFRSLQSLKLWMKTKPSTNPLLIPEPVSFNHPPPESTTGVKCVFSS